MSTGIAGFFEKYGGSFSHSMIGKASPFVSTVARGLAPALRARKYHTGTGPCDVASPVGAAMLHGSVPCYARIIHPQRVPQFADSWGTPVPTDVPPNAYSNSRAHIECAPARIMTKSRKPLQRKGFLPQLFMIHHSIFILHF